MSTSFLKVIQDRRQWTGLFLGVAFFGSAWTFMSHAPISQTKGGAPPPSPREGFSAFDFTLDLLDGGQVALSELRGQVVVINLWASWCPPCRAEMPAIEKVYREYQDQGLEVLAVNTTYQDQIEATRAFIQELGLSFPVPLDRTGSVSNRYQLRGLPSTFFVDRGGVIRSIVVGGPMSEALIRSKIQDLMAEGP